MAREPGVVRASLRSELLFQIGSLGAAAVLLALGTLFLLQLPFFARAPGFWLFLFIGLDLCLFLVFGSALFDRAVIGPLERTAAAAARIADGEYDHRVPRGASREVDDVGRAVNRLTDQLLQNQAKLAENIRSLDRTNRLLVETQRELVHKEKLASIGSLAAGVAHEIGNPLSSLLGYAGVLRRRGADADLVAGVEHEARRIDHIVRSLLDFARPGHDAREALDVNASILRVVDLLRGQGRLRSVEVVLELAEGLPAIEADVHALDQVWVNLFLNAAAAMDGEGRLEVTTRCAAYLPERPVPSRRADDPPGVDYSHLRRVVGGVGASAPRLEAGTEVVEVRICDSGPGVPAEVAEHIFDPFFTTKPPGEGTGLGLAIVSGTVAELRGRVELIRQEGRGATFVVSLPTRRETD